jgi:guanylate kinase
VLVNNKLTRPDETLAAIVRAERVRRNRLEEQIRPILESFRE